MPILFRLQALILAVGLSAASLAPSCGSSPRPPAPPIPSPTLRVVEFVLHDTTGSPVLGAHVTLQGGAANGDCQASATDGAGYTACTLVPRALTASQVIVTADGYADVSQHVDLPPDVNAWVLLGDPETKSAHDIHLDALQPRGPPAYVGRLSTSGVNFVTSDGSVWKYRGVTAFTALQDYAGGRDIAPYLAWVRSLGGNTVRVFGTWVVTDFDPRRTPDYYGALDRLCTLLAQDGLRIHFVALTDQVDGSSVRMSSAEQDAHVQRVVSILRAHDNTLLELSNEDWQNGKVSARFPRDWFVGVLTTRSSWQDGNTPLEVGSVLDWTTEHTPRGDQWERKSKNLLETSRLGLFPAGVPGFPPTHEPAVGGEPERLQNATPRQYADYLAVAELYGAGACLHGDGGSLQRLNVPADQSVAQAAAAVWADPPPADLASNGTYTRGGLADCPLVHRDRYTDDGQLLDNSGALRTFSMISGNRATAVVVSPGPGWTLQPTAGWHVVRQYGYQGNTVDLAR